MVLEGKLKGLSPQTEREKIVQELNDTKQEIEQLNTRKNELSETQEIAKLKRELKVKYGVELLIYNNVTNEQKRQILEDISKNIESIKAQGIEHIVIAHGEGSLKDGTWRMDGNSKANLETVGKHFADKHGKVLVVACENHLVRTGDGTNGYVFEKGKNQPTELNLSDKVENKNGVKLQQEELLHTSEAQYVVENFDLGESDTKQALEDIPKERLPEVLKTDPQILGILHEKYPELANNWIQNNPEIFANWIINASPEDVHKHFSNLVNTEESVKKLAYKSPDVFYAWASKLSIAEIDRIKKPLFKKTGSNTQETNTINENISKKLEEIKKGKSDTKTTKVSIDSLKLPNPTTIQKSHKGPLNLTSIIPKSQLPAGFDVNDFHKQLQEKQQKGELNKMPFFININENHVFGQMIIETLKQSETGILIPVMVEKEGTGGVNNAQSDREQKDSATFDDNATFKLAKVEKTDSLTVQKGKVEGDLGVKRMDIWKVETIDQNEKPKIENIELHYMPIVQIDSNGNLKLIVKNLKITPKKKKLFG